MNRFVKKQNRYVFLLNRLLCFGRKVKLSRFFFKSNISSKGVQIDLFLTFLRNLRVQYNRVFAGCVFLYEPLSQHPINP